MTDLERFYDLLTTATGIPRTTDMRLEFQARIRSQEAVDQVGYDRIAGAPPGPGGGIPHPPQAERQTRIGWSDIWPVGELATWNYLFHDPVQAAVDLTLANGTKVGLMNEPVHRAILLDPRWTHWGAGIYRTFKPGDDTTNPLLERWYFLIWLATGVPPVKAIVVNGTSTADGLTASYLSAKYAAPILLTAQFKMPAGTHDRLAELAPSEIIVVGGPAVVDESVATALSVIAPVRRVAGPDRYATAVAVSKA